MKLFKPFTPDVIVWSVRKGLISRFAERKNRKRDCSV